MTGETTITVSVILTLISVLCTLYNTFRGKNREDKDSVEHRIQEATSRVAEMTKINVKLDGIGADLRYIREDNNNMRKEVKQLHTDVELLKASIRSAHKRMDGAGIGRADIEVERKV